MPLILVGLSAAKAAGAGDSDGVFGTIRYTPGMRQCVVKQFQPSGNLTSTQLELAQKLFEREASLQRKSNTTKFRLVCFL